MDLESCFEVHAQGSLVVLFGPRSLPSSLDRVGCRITLSDVQLVSAELVASGTQKCGAYTLCSMSGGYKETHDRADRLGGIIYDVSIPPHV
jgi:hypothetical protein